MNREKYWVVIPLMLLMAASCKKTQQTKPVRKNITESVFASGELIPENEYELTAVSDGYLVAAPFKEGDIIPVNFIMAKIENRQSVVNARSSAQLLAIARRNVRPDAPALQEAFMDIQNARKKTEQDSLLAARYSRLYQTNSVAKADYENAQLNYNTSVNNLKARIAAYDNLKQQSAEQLIANQSQHEINKIVRNETNVSAVFPGKVYEKQKEAGDYVKTGDVIAVMGHPDSLYARLSVDENNIAKIKRGQEVIIRLNANKTKAYKGKVKDILPAFDLEEQSFYVDVYFTDSLDFKISGTQLQANVIIATKKNALLIPRAYLRYGGKVAVKKGGSTDTVTVTTGFMSSDWVEIIKGLDENATIIADQ